MQYPSLRTQTLSEVRRYPGHLVKGSRRLLTQPLGSAEIVWWLVFPSSTHLRSGNGLKPGVYPAQEPNDIRSKRSPIRLQDTDVKSSTKLCGF